MSFGESRTPVSGNGKQKNPSGSLEVMVDGRW